MTSTQALAPHLVRPSRLKHAIVTVLLGVVALSALAQINIRLPFTPVPITGQTFGVTLIALLYGRKLGTATVASYLGLGALGLPIFANAAAGFAMGPTIGYLFGMLVSSAVIGTLADHGATRSAFRAFAAGIAGSLFTFAFGVGVLSFFIPREALLTAGVLPFIAGDVIKCALAAMIATGSDHMLRR